MARPRKLLNSQTSNLTLDEIEKKKEEEKELYNYTKLNFNEYPQSLLENARIEWDRIAAYIGELPISELDENTLVRYCNYTILYANVTRELQKQGALINGKKNPLVDVMNSYSKELKSATSDLGLTINSRLRIVAPQKIEDESADIFGNMLKVADSDD